LRLCDLNRFLPFVSFLQILATEWAEKRNFSFGPAADSADFAVYCRTETAGPTLFADLAENRLRHSL
jgi:hypothetical protein